MEIKNTSLIAGMLGLLGIIFLPLGVIWAVNTLFLFNIEYNFINWLASMFLQVYFQVIIKAGSVNSKASPKKTFT